MQTDYVKYTFKSLSISLPYISPYGYSEFLMANHCLQLPTLCCYTDLCSRGSRMGVVFLFGLVLTPEVANENGNGCLFVGICDCK